MKKLLHFVLFCALAFCCFYLGSLAADRQELSDRWIRIHVVAASDSPADQEIKLQVRNGLLDMLAAQLEGADEARALQGLQEALPRLQDKAQEILASCGSGEKATVTLQKEAFPRRLGDGYQLPAGVYETLRVTIGEGKGHNWWGILYPQAWQQEAVSTALTKEGTPEIRFFFLEKWGQLQTWWKERKQS